jgi:hypothetical protein
LNSRCAPLQAFTYFPLFLFHILLLSDIDYLVDLLEKFFKAHPRNASRQQLVQYLQFERDKSHGVVEGWMDVLLQIYQTAAPIALLALATRIWGPGDEEREAEERAHYAQRGEETLHPQAQLPRQRNGGRSMMGPDTPLVSARGSGERKGLGGRGHA